MSRDYKKETAVRKKKVKRFVVDVERDMAEKFIEALKKSEKTYSEWVKENIEKFLKNI